MGTEKKSSCFETAMSLETVPFFCGNFLTSNTAYDTLKLDI